MKANKVYIGGQKYKWVKPLELSDELKSIITYANNNDYDLPTDLMPYDELIIDLKSTGIWDKLDAFYVFAGDGSNNWKLLNWLNPSLYEGEAFGGLSWSVDGVKGNDLNGYIETNLPLSTSGLNYELNNASRFSVIYEQDSGSGDVNTKPIDGLSSSNSQFMQNSDTYGQRINNTSNLGGVGYFSGTGLKALTRNSNTHVTTTSKNSEITRTGASVNIPTGTQHLLRRYSNIYGSAGISCYGVGSYLTYAELQTFRTIYNNFLTALGLTPVA